jgi:hypothetical protein
MMSPLILADEVTAAVNRGAAVPGSWAGRALYVGPAGAANWIAVVQEPGYPLRTLDDHGLRAHRHAALAGRRFATLVSLGPGDGTVDVDLIEVLAREVGPDAGPPAYVPVDLARPLLERSIEVVAPHAARVVGLHCDFEGASGFLDESVRRYTVPPVLFALLGGTVGNLDEGEERFFAAARRRMGPADAFLLDVPLAGPAWNADIEPRLGLGGYSAAFRRFLGLPGVPDADLERRVAFEHRPDDATGAETIAVSDRLSGRRLLMFRRYRWGPILDWFGRQGFRVAFARSSLSSGSDRFGMGVVLLTVT